MDFETVIGIAISIAGSIIGFLVWTKTNVSVLISRLDQLEAKVKEFIPCPREECMGRFIKMETKQEEHEKEIFKIDGLRIEFTEIKERLIRIETLLERIIKEK